jgi:hypothetical protein
LVAAFPVLMGNHKRTVSEALGLVQGTRQQLRLPQGQMTERLVDNHGCSHGLFQCRCEQRYRVSNAPAQHIGLP